MSLAPPAVGQTTTKEKPSVFDRRVTHERRFRRGEAHSCALETVDRHQWIGRLFVRSPDTPSPSHLFENLSYRKDAEESHTAVGVHRLAPREGEAMEPMGGRGVLEGNGHSSRRGGGRGEYELVATSGGDGRHAPGSGGASEAPGIRKVVEG